jgi:hypothetical protein
MAEEDRRIFQALDALGNEPVTPERVQVPEFEIVSNPTIPLSEIRNRRFNLVDREQPRFMEASWVANPVDLNTLIQRKETSFTNVPRPYCPTFWERLLGDDSV